MTKFNDYPRFTLAENINQEQRDFFQKMGFIHFKSFLNQETVELLKQEMTRIQSEWISEKRTAVNGVPIVYGKDVDGKIIVQRFAFSNQFSDVFANLLRGKRIAQLYNVLDDKWQYRVSEKEKDGLVINHYVNNPGSRWAQMGWHTDSLRDIFYGQKVKPMLNVGIHLDDSTPYNGGLSVLPGTHNKGLATLLFKKLYFIDKKVDKNELVVNVKAGDLTIHDGRAWHRARPGTVEGERSRRRVMYFPIITGKVLEKSGNSKPALYHHLVKKGTLTAVSK